jgi:hypothetical protein
MQLRKNPPFNINAEDPFQDDKLNHKSSIELLSKLVQSTDQPFVIAVEAPWGWGKTKFVERWKAYLAKQNHVCLYFNAWENDFVADPLTAFVGELRPIVENAHGGKDKNSAVSKGFDRLSKLGVILAKKGAPILIKAAASKILTSEAVKDVSEAMADSAEKVAEALSESVKKQIEKYDEEKIGIKNFRETLQDLAEQVTAAEGKPKQLVFFVDELDRCRPDFAMTLLERIKHLFSVEKIVFVLAIDRSQLRNTVHCLYGSGEHADVYLRRFIDFSFQLPKPSTRIFAELLHSRFKMLEFFNSGRANAQIEYDRFLPSFIDTANWLNLDLRTQEQCFTRLNAIFRLHDRNDFIPTDCFCVLTGLRVGKPESFVALQSGKASPTEHLPHPNTKFENLEFRTLVETTLKVVFSPEQQTRQEIEQLQTEVGMAKGQPAAYSLTQKMHLLQHLQNHRTKLLRLMEFADKFS